MGNRSSTTRCIYERMFVSIPVPLAGRFIHLLTVLLEGAAPPDPGLGLLAGLSRAAAGTHRRPGCPPRQAPGMRPGLQRLLAGMKIAVIGKGNIGGSLGSKWREAGHDVVYGAREAVGEGPGGAPVRSIADAIDGA